MNDNINFKYDMAIILSTLAYIKDLLIILYPQTLSFTVSISDLLFLYILFKFTLPLSLLLSSKTMRHDNLVKLISSVIGLDG